MWRVSEIQLENCGLLSKQNAKDKIKMSDEDY